MLETQSEGPSTQEGRATDSRRPRNNIMAVFRDLTSARRAISALGQTNIETENISLSGPQGETDVYEPYKTEMEVLIERFLENRVAVGASIGAALGAILGLFISVGVISGLFGADLSIGMILATMLFSGIGMAAMGGFVTGTDGIQSGPQTTSTTGRGRPCCGGRAVRQAQGHRRGG